MSALSLRPYQLECRAAIEAALAAGTRRQLVQLPTGGGKTVVFAGLPALGLRRLLVVAHREELLEQASEKLHAWNPGIKVWIDQAEREAPTPRMLFNVPETYAVCASVATIGRGGKRLERWQPADFDAVVIDEAHHAAAKSYQNVMRHLAAGQPDGPALLGFTATPFRGDGVSLSGSFDQLVFQRTIPDLIDAGYLVDLRCIQVSTTLNLDGVKANRDDFVQGELERVVNTPARNAQTVKAWMEQAADRPTIAFATGRQHGHDLAETFRACGVSVVYVDGETIREERRARLEDFRAGRARVLVNVGIATEGFDEPSVACILLCRPTKSAVLYTQMVGRVTRLCEGKTDGLVIDMVDVASKHSLVHAAQLFGLPDGMDLAGQSAMSVRRRVREMTEQLGIPYDLIAKHAATAADLDAVALSFKEGRLLDLSSARATAGISELVWVSTGPSNVMIRAGAFAAFVSVDILGRATLRLREYDGHDVSSQHEESFATFAEAVHVGDSWLRAHAPRALIDPKASWRQRGASEKQLAFLKRLRIPHDPRTLTMGQAGILISRRIGR